MPMRIDFIERTLGGMLRAVELASVAERGSGARGLLQSIDPRAKLVGILAIVVAIAFARNLATVAAFVAIAFTLAAISRVRFTAFVKLWAILLLFTALIVLPALFTTPGTAVGSIGGLEITRQGLRAVAFLGGRVFASATLAFVLVMTTSWSRLFAALRSLRVPAPVVLVLAMTVRYLFVLLRTATEMFVARRARTVASDPGVGRHVTASTAGVLLGKSLDLSEEIYLAMQSRGFQGEVRLTDDLAWRARDTIAALAAFAIAGVGIWKGLR